MSRFAGASLKIAREVLGNHRRQSQQSRLELGLCLNNEFEWQIIRIVDAHRGDGKRFVVRANEKLTAFIELELAIRAGGE
jgi:hypothetical protein